jgi:hypothetical protein
LVAEDSGHAVVQDAEAFIFSHGPILRRFARAKKASRKSFDLERDGPYRVPLKQHRARVRLAALSDTNQQA